MFCRWSKQEGIDYFLKYTTDPLSSIENEINRYISWPGQVSDSGAKKNKHYIITHMQIKCERSKNFNNKMTQG